MSMNEEWRVAPGYSRYEVSSLGRVRDMKRDRILEPYKIDKPRDGYARVGMSRDSGGYAGGVRIHILVAAAFLGSRPTGMQINHKDGNKMNAAVSNLEYVTQSRNQRHACENDLRPVKLDLDKADEIRDLIRQGEHPVHIAERYGVSAAMITRVKQAKAWVREGVTVPVEAEKPMPKLRRNRKSLPPRPCGECGQLVTRIARGRCMTCYMRYRREGIFPPPIGAPVL